MPSAWYLCLYKRRPDKEPTRYCAMDDFTPQITANLGKWHETEVLGGFGIVKVHASIPTLQEIASTAGFQRLPKDQLDDALVDLTPAQKMVLRDQLVAMGYPLAEIRAVLGNDLGSHTLRDVLHFAATRRRKPRYDAVMDMIVLDGPIQPCRPVDDVNQAVM